MKRHWLLLVSILASNIAFAQSTSVVTEEAPAQISGGAGCTEPACAAFYAGLAAGVAAFGTPAARGFENAILLTCHLNSKENTLPAACGSVTVELKNQKTSEKQSLQFRGDQFVLKPAQKQGHYDVTVRLRGCSQERHLQGLRAGQTVHLQFDWPCEKGPKETASGEKPGEAADLAR